MKALGFDTVFSNALIGFDIGAAVGVCGSDFYPLDKSKAELQRFCPSYKTELSKYIGPAQDTPWMGMGVGKEDMAYLFVHFKRINPEAGSGGLCFLSGDFSEVRTRANKLCESIYRHVHALPRKSCGHISFCSFSSPNSHAPGYGVAHYAHANEMLQDQGDTLEGKRCFILGAGKAARSLASNLLEFGAIPLTLSDASGSDYEPQGFTDGSLRTITKIKDERGALLGRYIISSTTAQINHPDNLLDLLCDLC
jgi:glutamate dehydrogenase (NADP+)